jgi:methyltransferase-like protein
MDFLRNRPFRRAVLARHALGDRVEFQAAALGLLHVASPLTRDLKGAGSDFVHPNGGRLQGTSDVLSTALSYMQEIYPASVPYGTLLEKTVARHADLAGEKVAQGLARGILEGYTAGLLEMSVQGDAFVTACGGDDTPRASEWARYQAKSSPVVTNLKNQQVQLTDEERGFLQLATGTETVKSLGAPGVLRRLAERALFCA